MSDAYRSLLAEIRRARRLLLAREVERAALWAGAALLATGALALLAALVLPLYRPQYAVLRSVLLAAAAVLVVAAVARVLAGRKGLPEAALEAGRLGGERDDELLTALELGRELPADPDAEGPRYSGELRESAVRAAAERARALPLGRLRLWRGRGRWLAAAGAALAALLVVGLAGGARTPAVIGHMMRPEAAPAPPIRIRVEPGDREVESGSSVRVQVFIAGTGARPQLLTSEGARGAAGGDRRWRTARLVEAQGDPSARAGERAFQAVLPNVKEDLAYYVRAGGARTGEYELRVLDLPRATSFRVRYEYPAYTGLHAEESQNLTGDLAAPRGSRALLTLTTNRNVASAAILTEGSRATVEGRPGERLATFSLPIRSDDRYHIRLVDLRGRRVDLGPYEIRAIPDRPPTVTVLAPGDVEDVSQDMVTTIVAGATDDYGVKRFLIRYKVQEKPEVVETLHEEKEPARELALRYTWPLQSFSLLPGEEIEYAVGAVDADAVDGPQTTWSGTRRIRFPSASEILASMDEKHDETVESLDAARKQAEELQSKADELARDIGRTHDLPWEKRQEIQKTLEGQQSLQERIDRAAQKLSDDADKLQQSRALNAELVQKLSELHDLLSRIKDDTIRRSIQRMQEALQKMSPEEIKRALENFKMSQEQVLQNLDRTIQMLKQLQTEERMEEASERAAEMERRQLALNDSLARASKKEDRQALAPSEHGIEQMSQETKAALDSLAAALRELDRQAAEEAAQLSKALGPQGMQQDFQGAEGALSQGDESESQQATQSLAQQLQEMRRRIDQMRAQFQQRRKNDMAQRMEAAARDLIEISDAQKMMLGDASSTPDERADTQQGLQETTSGATDRIAKLGRETLFITSDVTAALGRALMNQQNAVGRYSAQDLVGGLVSSRESAIALNQAAAALLKGIESMASSASSSGFREAMQQMQGLGESQQQLNQQSSGLMQQLSDQGRLVPDPGGMMGRLAAQQEAIRQGLEDAMDKMGPGKNALGRMGDVGDDMKKVVEDLKSGRLNQQTLDRQQRILSRLLDAPRSVEKRDYSRRRTSRPGVDVVRSSPGALSPDLLRARPSLAALLAKGARDPVTPRYRALVDEYFQALLAGKAR